MKTLIRSSLYLLALLCLSSLCRAGVYAQFTGRISTEGDSQALNREHWVDLSAFSAGIENTVTIGGASTGAGRASFAAFKISKWVDPASIGLMSSSVQGEAYDEVIIEVTATESEALLLRIEMKLVFVESLSMDQTDGEEQIQEKVSLQYGAHRITTFTLDPETNQSTPSGVHVWSVVRNTASYEI